MTAPDRRINWALWRARWHIWLGWLVAVLCAVLPNATTVILLAPIIIRIARALDVAAADRAIARRHGYVFARAVKTAALAHAGRASEAAEALSAIRHIDPSFSLSRLSHYPFVLSDQRRHLYSGLTAAGLENPDATSAAR